MASKRTRVLAAHLLPHVVSSSEQPVTQKRVGITFHFQDELNMPSRRRAAVQWDGPIRRVLLVKKWNNQAVTAAAVEIAAWLASKGIVILVESAEIAEYPHLVPAINSLDTSGDTKEPVDLVVSLGGDGTLLHASRLFRFLERVNKLIPPCLVLGMGSLGFLASVPADQWKPALTSVLDGTKVPVPCTLRTRLSCTLRTPGQDRSKCENWYALNECTVLVRGRTIGKLHVFVDGMFVTVVEGDGIIVSSPTGSTGYSLSCGGPVVSPSVPCTLLTPIAPASLSFRPLLISELSTVEIVLPPKARIGSAEVIVDGRMMGKLKRGEKAVITTARPIPVLNVAGLDRDWFEAINNKLKWNARDVEQADMEP